MNIFGIGLPEMAVIAAIGLLVFGPKRLPELGKTLGKTLKGFQSASSQFEQEFRKAVDTVSNDTVSAAAVAVDAASVQPASAQPVPTQPLSAQPVSPAVAPTEIQAVSQTNSAEVVVSELVTGEPPASAAGSAQLDAPEPRPLETAGANPQAASAPLAVTPVLASSTSDSPLA
jgi:sec-independent protein translocase protein TatA